MRRTFFDILNSVKFDVSEEYRNLKYLFYEECSVPISGYLKPLSEYIDNTYFRELDIHIRQGTTDLDSLAQKVNVSSFYTYSDLDSLYVFCEFLYALLPDKQIKGLKNRFLESQVKTIKDNIAFILEKTNHELKRSPKHYDNYIIVEKNKATTLAAEIVEDIEVAYDLIEYNHYALKGDLEGKKKILMSLGSYIEPILRSRILQKSGYGKIESDVGFLLNKFHIRHNNKTGAKAQEYIVSLKDSDLELWYDRAYEMILTVIIINNNLSVYEELDNLKKTYKWKE